MNQFRFKNFVGSGEQGRVLAVESQMDLKVYAAKQIRAQDFDEELATLLIKLDHPNIVKFHSFEVNKKHAYFVMEMIQGRNLYGHIRGVCLAKCQIEFYSTQLARALQYLHSYNIIYRDLKPENLILMSNGQLKLIDFDLSKVLKGSSKTRTVCGTPLYMAPECVKGRPYGKSVDYWSLGVLMYEMTFGRTPFEADNVYEIYQKIVAEEDLVIPDIIDANLKDLILQLLDRNPKRRRRANFGCFFRDTRAGGSVQETDAPFIP